MKQVKNQKSLENVKKAFSANKQLNTKCILGGEDTAVLPWNPTRDRGTGGR